MPNTEDLIVNKVIELSALSSISQEDIVVKQSDLDVLIGQKVSVPNASDYYVSKKANLNDFKDAILFSNGDIPENVSTNETSVLAIKVNQNGIITETSAVQYGNMLFQNYKIVEKFPQNPDPNTFYFIKTLSPPYIYNSLANVWIQIDDLCNQLTAATDKLNKLNDGKSINTASIVTSAEYGITLNSTPLTNYLHDTLNGYSNTDTSSKLCVENGIVLSVDQNAIRGGLTLQPTNGWACISANANNQAITSPITEVLESQLGQITTNSTNITEISNKTNSNNSQITTINGYLNNGETVSNGLYLVNTITKGIVTSYSTYNKPKIGIGYFRNNENEQWENTSIKNSYTFKTKTFDRIVFIPINTSTDENYKLKIIVNTTPTSAVYSNIALKSNPYFMVPVPSNTTFTIRLTQSDGISNITTGTQVLSDYLNAITYIYVS